MVIVTEETNSPEFIHLIKRPIDIQHINREFGRIQFLDEMARKMERLIPRVTKYYDTTVTILIHEFRDN
jgi:hypothetical protein